MSNQPPNERQENAQDPEAPKQITPEEAAQLTDLCSKQADQFLQHIRPFFATREEEFGTQWAIENYIRMALLPGIYVMRQSLSDEAIKEMMPLLEKMIMSFEIVIDEEKKEENNEV